MNKTFFMFILIITASLHIGCQQRLRPEERSVRLVEDSQSLGGELSVKLTIEKWLKEKGEEVRPVGWRVTKKDDQVYLVGYKYRIFSFEEGSGERGFFFEVNLANEVVHDVTETVIREMGSLAPPLRNDKNIPEELLNKWENTEKRLSGGDP